MKMKKMILSAALICSAGILSAQNLNVQLVQPDAAELKFKIHVHNPLNKRITVNIANNQLGILESKTINGNNYSMIYDLSQLEDGNYFIEVIAGEEKIRKDIRINTSIQVNRTAAISEKKKIAAAF